LTGLISLYGNDANDIVKRWVIARRFTHVHKTRKKASKGCQVNDSDLLCSNELNYKIAMIAIKYKTFE